MPELTPISFWIGFHVFLLLLLVAELLYARRRANREPQRSSASSHRTAVVATLLWVTAALAFSIFIYRTLGRSAASEYVAGYAIEESLSVDNLLVFLLLFGAFRIKDAIRPRVLFWGVLGAILMRGLFIAGGLHLLERFAWVNYVFGAVLLIAAARLMLQEKEGDAEKTPPWINWLRRLHPVSLRQDRFFTREDGRLMATILLLALVAIELTDVFFALDSIPAVLSITRHPFLAYTSNIMAVMGLRSMFFLLAHLLTRLRFLHLGLGIVLGFAALKMLLEPRIVVGPLLSLGIVATILSLTIVTSIRSPLLQKVQSPSRSKD